MSLQGRWHLIGSQANILGALMLQDMKTRFGASYISYLIAIGWPFSHIAAIAVGYLIANRMAPLGDDPLVFIATAAVPYMTCLYPARLIGVGILINRALLSYSVITPLHLMFSRCALEFLNVALVIGIATLICYSIDRDILPVHLVTAAQSLAACVFFGVSFGIFNAVITAVVGIFYNVFVVVVMILLFIGSLSYVPHHMLSSTILYYLGFNPIFVFVEWQRSAYYDYYQLHDIPKGYVLGISCIFLFLGLAGERAVRGRILQA